MAKDILIQALESAYAKYITFVTFIYLTVQFYAIVGGTIIGVPDPYRLPTIIISIVIIILYVFYKARILFQQSQILYDQLAKPMNHSVPINENLRYHDVEFAIYYLVKKIIDSNFLIYTDNQNNKFDTEKNIIIGIDRGGAILGGLLGKNLRLAAKTLAVYYANPPLRLPGEVTAIQSGKCLDNIDFSFVKKVILVDDAIREGRTLEQAIRILEDKKKVHDFEYKIACILKVNPWQGHPRPLPHFFVYQTQDMNLQLPWDVHWDTMQPNKEFEEQIKKVM